MQATSESLSALFNTLGLTPHDSATAYGRRAGFPISLRLAKLDAGIEALFCQIRHRLDEPPTLNPETAFNAELTKQIAANDASVSLEPKGGWLILYRGTRDLAGDRVPALLDEFLHGLEAAGIEGSEACHYCESEAPVQAVFNGTRVGQICTACLKTRADAWASGRELRREDLPKLASRTALAALAGAAIWAAIWLGLDLGFSLMGWQEVSMPMKLLLLVGVGLGFGAAWPIASILRHVSGRGDLAAGFAGGFAALIAIAVGEILCSAAMIYQTYHVLSLSIAVKVAPALLLDSGQYTLQKGYVALIMVGAAFMLARPKKATLEL